MSTYGKNPGNPWGEYTPGEYGGPNYVSLQQVGKALHGLTYEQRTANLIALANGPRLDGHEARVLMKLALKRMGMTFDSLQEAEEPKYEA